MEIEEFLFDYNCMEIDTVERYAKMRILQQCRKFECVAMIGFLVDGQTNITPNTIDVNYWFKMNKSIFNNKRHSCIVNTIKIK